VAVIAIAGDHLVAVGHGQLHADDDRFLADIEMAESPDQPHAVHLSGFFLETPDQQHLPECLELFLLAEIGNGTLLHGPVDGTELLDALFCRLGYGHCHRFPRYPGRFIP